MNPVPPAQSAEPAVLMLKQAMPGKALSSKESKKFLKKVSTAWRFWQDRKDRRKWAVFLVVGQDMSEVDRKGIRNAIDVGLTPVVIAPTFSEIKATTPYYPGLRFHVICNIAGHGRLIPSLPAGKQISRSSKSPTRVPLS